MGSLLFLAFRKGLFKLVSVPMDAKKPPVTS